MWLVSPFQAQTADEVQGSDDVAMSADEAFHRWSNFLFLGMNESEFRYIWNLIGTIDLCVWLFLYKMFSHQNANVKRRIANLDKLPFV